MSRKFARKAVYYRRTFNGVTKWVKIEGAKYVEQGERLELSYYKELYPSQRFQSPRTYVREEA